MVLPPHWKGPGGCGVGENRRLHHPLPHQWVPVHKHTLIFDLLVAEERRTGSLATIIWWEQEGIRLGNEGRGADESEMEWE